MSLSNYSNITMTIYNKKNNYEIINNEVNFLEEKIRIVI